MNYYSNLFFIASVFLAALGYFFFSWGWGWWSGINVNPEGRTGQILADTSCFAGAIFWVFGIGGILQWSMQF